MNAVSEAPDTRDCILRAAEDLFAKQGFAGTTIKQIGEHSETNPALLYYYFGSKDSLYEAVIGQLAAGLARRAAAGLAPGAAGPEDQVRGLLRAQAAFLHDHPSAPALMVREMLDHDGQHAGAFLPVVTRLFSALCDTIERGQREGRFTAALDARFTAISVIAQLLYFRLAKSVVRRLLGSDDPEFPSAELQRRFAAHAGEFAVRALGTDQSGGGE